MTLGAGDNDLSGGDLAYLMSAQEDRMLANATSGVLPQASPALEINRQLDPSEGVNYAGGSSYSEGLPLLPSSAGLTGVMGAGVDHDAREAREALCGSLAGADGLFETIGRTDTYLTLMKGKPWPTPLNEGKISAGYIEPTVMSRVSNINQGWNAAAQPGSPPGLNVGYSDMTIGATSWAEAMEYSPSPLADKIGELQGLGAISVGASDPGMRKVLKAAANPGTQAAGKVARELVAQSIKLGVLTSKRAQVMENARKCYTSLVRQVANIDSQTQLIAQRLFDADGTPGPSVSVADIQAYRKLRQKGFKLGREAIRYQKTNVVATGLTKNGFAQAELLQGMAMTMMTGKPRTTAVLAAQFEALGKESNALKILRKVQVTSWKAKDAPGLEGFSSPVQQAVNADYWEADLAGMELVEMAYLGALEGWWSSVKKAAKSVGKAAKAVGRAAKKAGKAAVKGVSKAAKAAKKAAQKAAKAAVRAAASAARVAKKAAVSAARAARKAARKAADAVARAAKKTVRAAARKVARAAKKAWKKVGTPIVNTVKAVARPAWKGVKAAGRIVIEPVKMTYNVGKNVARGDFKGAANSIVKSVKDTANNIAKVGAAYYFGMSCAFDKTPLGKFTTQARAQAAGTILGGDFGGAVGKEAGRKANQISRGICDGMDKVGLTTGKLRPGKIVSALKQTGSRIAKETFSPKELLKSGINIATNYTTGGSMVPGGTEVLSQGGQAILDKSVDYAVKYGKKKGRELLQKELKRQGVPGMDVLSLDGKKLMDRGVDYVKKYGQRKGKELFEREIRKRVIDKNPILRRLSRQTPGIQRALQQTGAFTSRGVNMDVLKRSIRRQTTQALSRAIPGAPQIMRTTPAQRRALLRRQAMRQQPRRGVRQATQHVRPRATVAARRAQAMARMSPARRQAYLRQQAMRAGLQRRRPALKRRPTPAQIMQNRAIARARAIARQRMGVPGALLRA